MTERGSTVNSPQRNKAAVETYAAADCHGKTGEPVWAGSRFRQGNGSRLLVFWKRPPGRKYDYYEKV